MSDEPEAERKAILARLKVIGRTMKQRQQVWHDMADERRELYQKGERVGLTHRSMAEAQGISEGAVTLALRKIPGRAAERAEAEG